MGGMMTMETGCSSYMPGYLSASVVNEADEPQDARQAATARIAMAFFIFRAV